MRYSPYAALMLLALGAPVHAHAQRIPLNPTRMAECDAMRPEFDARIEAAKAQHDSCLSAHNKDPFNYSGTCERKACQELHGLADIIAGQRNEAISHCRNQVRAFEAEVRRREE